MYIVASTGSKNEQNLDTGKEGTTKVEYTLDVTIHDTIQQ